MEIKLNPLTPDEYKKTTFHNIQLNKYLQTIKKSIAALLSAKTELIKSATQKTKAISAC
jgi:hypothetical protein